MSAPVIIIGAGPGGLAVAACLQHEGIAGAVILDEADQMLKLGFKEDIEEILRFVKRQAKDDLQVCLFSATIPTWVRSVANYHMK